MVEISSDNISEEAGAEMFENWRQEVLDFSKMIVKEWKNHERKTT